MYFLGFVVWLVSLPLLATTQISSHIYEIDVSKGSHEVTLVLLTTGQVTKIPYGKSEILYRLLESKNKDQLYDFIVDDARRNKLLNRFVTGFNGLNNISRANDSGI